MQTTLHAPQTRMSTVDALGRLAQSRDPLAWAAILEQHGAGILNVAQRITGDSALCDDVCQETLLQIREHAGHFEAPPQDAEASARGWIMRIATCTAFKVLRMRQRSDRRETLATQNASQAAPSAAELAITREQAERVRREVAELPETYREPISLRFYGALEYPEVGMALGCSQDAAKKRVQRGLEMLRSRMAGVGVALSLGAVMSALASGTTHAAEISAAMATSASAGSAPTGGTQIVSQVLDPQRLAEWQGLLHSTHAPALSGVVLFGGLTVMAKKILGAAAIILFLLAGVGALEISRLQDQNEAAKASAAKNAANIRELEKKLNERVNDAGLLHDKLAAREAEMEKLREQIAGLEKKAASRSTPNDVVFQRFVPQGDGQPTIAWAPAPNGVKPGDKKSSVTVNGQKIEVPIGADNFIVGNPGDGAQFEIALPPDFHDRLQGRLREIQGQFKGDDAKIKAAIDEALKTLPVNKEVREFNLPGGGNVKLHIVNGGAAVQLQAEGNDPKPVKPPAPENVPNF